MLSLQAEKHAQGRRVVHMSIHFPTATSDECRERRGRITVLLEQEKVRILLDGLWWSEVEDGKTISPAWDGLVFRRRVALYSGYARKQSHPVKEHGVTARRFEAKPRGGPPVGCCTLMS